MQLSVWVLGDVLEGDYLEEMIEAVGEDMSIRVMDIQSASFSRMTDILLTATSNDSLNRIWKKRYINNSKTELSNGQDQGWAHAKNSVEVLGIKQATKNYIKDCE
jgi:hypothetical protein